MQEVNRKADFKPRDTILTQLTQNRPCLLCLLSLFGICQSNLHCEDADKSNKEQFAVLG